MAKKNVERLSCWKKLFAEGESDTAYHKRLVSVISLVMLVILSILSAFGHSSTIEFIYVFGILTGGESLLTTIEKTSERISRTKHIIRRDNINGNDIDNEEITDD